MAVDPIHQFQIINLFPIAKIGDTEIAFTNSAAFMLIAVVGITAVPDRRHRRAQAWCPSRLQSVAEMSYEFVATTMRSTAGTEGMKFFPFVFTLFMFILTLNMIGLIPYTFTVTSHIIVTAALALTVFLTVLIYGLYAARPALLQPVRAEGHADLHPAADRLHRDAVVPLAADLAQRASVRQHAGRPHHAARCSPASSSCWAAASARSAGSAACCRSRMIVVLIALETLVAFLQAYVFAILTCIYLNDAIHPGH